ncbi:MAG: hypothetical protein ACFNQA_05205 [Flavobacteriaceae bacterium]
MKIFKENQPDILAFVEVSPFFVPTEGLSQNTFQMTSLPFCF